MVQRVVVESLQGATISISATLPATYDVAGYDVSSIVFTKIGEVENYGNHGMTAAVTEFTPIDTGVVTKVKGSKNYGTISLTMGNLPSNAGQVLLKTASESSARYSVEIRYPDNEYHYLEVLVSKLEYQDGSVNDVQKLAVDLAICRTPVIVPQV